MLARLVFWAILGVLAWWAVVRVRVRPGRPAAPDAARQVPMLQCAYCGMHFPESEGSASADGRPFCSVQHRQSALHADAR